MASYIRAYSESNYWHQNGFNGIWMSS